MKVYGIIPESMYKELNSTVKLNGFLRKLFSKINNAEELDEILEEAIAVRDAFFSFQPLMLKRIKTTSILSNMPVVLIRDKNRNGSKFLRWRFFLENNKCGTRAFDSIVLDGHFEKDIRLALIEVEKERTILNMQIGILSQTITYMTKAQKTLKRANELEKMIK